MNVLVINPGGNSLKVEIVTCDARQQYAFEGRSLLSIGIEGIGKSAELSRYDGKEAVHSEPIKAADFRDAVRSLIAWCRANGYEDDLKMLDCIGLRVVHGGVYFDAPALVDSAVEEKIVSLEKLAPLHNKSSVEVLAPLRAEFPDLPISAVFDTAFHRTIPERAALYAIPAELAEKHHIRRYGFHGISHRYLLERYAFLIGKRPDDCNIVSTHLESGCSVTAIHQGESIDNTMGLTPLEGLMMGTRSGDVDPSIVPLLMKEEGMSIDEVMTLLNKKSGLLAVSGESLDTRVLMKDYSSNPRVKLAMHMFAYRLRKAVGSFLAVVGSADALVFGGGIGENNPLVREYVCEGLRSFGLEVDHQANKTLIDIEGRLSTESSKLQVWVIPTQESLQIAHECCSAISDARA
jgi:acetate kinase